MVSLIQMVRQEKNEFSRCPGGIFRARVGTREKKSIG